MEAATSDLSSKLKIDKHGPTAVSMAEKFHCCPQGASAEVVHIIHIGMDDVRRRGYVVSFFAERNMFVL